MPFEDFLGIGMQSGFSNISVPGSGIANFDSYEADPYQTRNQRKEREVHKLLDKLPPETISLNPHVIGSVDRAAPEVIQMEMEEEKKKKLEEKLAKKARKKAKKRTRGTEESKANKKVRRHDDKTR